MARLKMTHPDGRTIGCDSSARAKYEAQGFECVESGEERAAGQAADAVGDAESEAPAAPHAPADATDDGDAGGEVPAQ